MAASELVPDNDFRIEIYYTIKPWSTDKQLNRKSKSKEIGKL